MDKEQLIKEAREETEQETIERMKEVYKFAYKIQLNEVQSAKDVLKKKELFLKQFEEKTIEEIYDSHKGEYKMFKGHL